MTRSSLPLRILFTIVLSLTFAALAHAQVQRTFVSAQRGNDANTASLCSVVNPCRGFAAAISVVASGGEVIALDSGGYGAVTITKAVQITAPTGVYVAITASSGNAITISAGANDVVVLRGLTLNSLTSSASGTLTGGHIGIAFNSGKAVFVESCVINGFLDFGILFNSAGELSVKDTIVRNTMRYSGIFIYAGSGSVKAMIDHCRVERSSAGDGFLVGENAKVAISNSVATGSGGGEGAGFEVISNGELTVSNSTSADNDYGFYANVGEAGLTPKMTIESCIAKGNTYGMYAHVGSLMRVSNSTAVGNSFGFYRRSPAAFESRSNNTVRGNGNGTTDNVSGTITIIGGN